MVTKLSTSTLAGSAQTPLIPLHCRVQKSQEGHSHVGDEKALESVDSLDFDHFEGSIKSFTA
ncbi:MAG: hypothetical protein IT324_29505 [Anaerolineae bacterium]|nr:hypothetical protein [Anaerolineae bacterium]